MDRTISLRSLKRWELQLEIVLTLKLKSQLWSKTCTATFFLSAKSVDASVVVQLREMRRGAGANMLTCSKNSLADKFIILISCLTNNSNCFQAQLPRQDPHINPSGFNRFQPFCPTGTFCPGTGCGTRTSSRVRMGCRFRTKPFPAPLATWTSTTTQSTTDGLTFTGDPFAGGFATVSTVSKDKTTPARHTSLSHGIQTSEPTSSAAIKSWLSKSNPQPSWRVMELRSYQVRIAVDHHGSPSFRLILNHGRTHLWLWLACQTPRGPQELFISGGTALFFGLKVHRSHSTQHTWLCEHLIEPKLVLYGWLKTHQHRLWWSKAMVHTSRYTVSVPPSAHRGSIKMKPWTQNQTINMIQS